MNRWLTYFRERSPLAPLVILSVGAALSGAALGRHSADAVKIAVVVLGMLVFFLLARLMDEQKDFAKDVVAHPTRPLPRGLLTVAQVEQAVRWGAIGSLVLAAAFAFFVNRIAGGLFALTMVWLWLMYREFYIGRALAARPMLYAITHQVVLYPLYGFAIAVSSPEVTFSIASIGYCTANVGASMTYEIGRKLNPEAHPILKTYLSFYGRAKTAAWIGVFLVVAAIGAWLLGLPKVLWLVEAYVALTLVILFVRPARFKLVEGATALSVMVHLWSVFIAYQLGWWK